MNTGVNRATRAASWVASALLLAGASGCAAAAAGAGAAGAVYLTNNGAEARIEASVDETFDAARQALQEMNVTLTETSQTAVQPADTMPPADTVQRGPDAARRDDGPTKRELEGKAGDREVNVTIEQDGATTKVEVTAKTSAVTWDKDFAKQILEEIIENTRD